MIRIEELGQAWNVHIRVKDPAKEFALVVCGLMKFLDPEDMHKIIDTAKEHQDEFNDMTNKQLSLFHLRLAHLMEIHGTNLKQLIKELNISEADAYDLLNGSAPSMDCIHEICEKLSVDDDYLFKAI